MEEKNIRDFWTDAIINFEFEERDEQEKSQWTTLYNAAGDEVGRVDAYGTFEFTV